MTTTRHTPSLESPSAQQASPSRIYLSPPHLGELEQQLVGDAFATNWIAPLGPHVTAFEEEFCEAVQAPNAVALSSGTAAVHLALIMAGVVPGDEVVVSTLTFAGSVNPIIYCGARPVFIDSELRSWNMDPDLLVEFLRQRHAAGRRPRALILVHLYGQCADIDRIREACQQYDVILIEDAAEALGADYRGRPPGSFGFAGVFSFNGNKIITTGGGGMLVCPDAQMAARARNLAAQARDPAPHYQHSEIGYNYRLSNVLAAIGRGQLRVLAHRVAARRRVFDYYHTALSGLDGIEFMPEAPWGTHTRWLTCITIDPERFGCDREQLRLVLEEQNIEARPVWKPMHLQPVFAECEAVMDGVSERIFEYGLCLPSGSALTTPDLERIVSLVRQAARS
jgi:dTDP-4-amino-4,6-dideoxygalactose transaminase